METRKSLSEQYLFKSTFTLVPLIAINNDTLKCVLRCASSYGTFYYSRKVLFLLKKFYLYKFPVFFCIGATKHAVRLCHMC